MKQIGGSQILLIGKNSLIVRAANSKVTIAELHSSLYQEVIKSALQKFSDFYDILLRQQLLYWMKSPKFESMTINEQITKANGGLGYRTYKTSKIIGRGAFGICYQVERVDNQKKYAMKIIPKIMMDEVLIRQKMHSEIELHRLAKHQNIVQLKKVFQDQNNIYMVMELCSNETMAQYLAVRKKLTVSQAQFYLYQLINALCYLHSHNIIHRDIKLTNLLLDEKMNLKLADFGLATRVLFSGDKKHSKCGTPLYIAPQILGQNKGEKGSLGHSYEVDIWGVGIILYQLLTGKQPFLANSRQGIYNKIISQDYQFPQSLTMDSAKDLIRNILVVDVEKRYTFQQILDHPFMNPQQGIPKEIPTSALKSPPKFKEYQKQQQNEIKETARIITNTNIRENHYMRKEELVENICQGLNRQSAQSKEKKFKSLVHTVFSATSLPKSLEKLNKIEKCLSNQNIQLEQSSKNNNKTTKFQATTKIEKQSVQECQKVQSFIYIRFLRKDEIWTYLLTNGYIGTYESAFSSYKILHNKTLSYFFQINDGKCTLSSNNQNIIKRYKYINALASMSDLKCTALRNMVDPVYLMKAYEIKAQNCTLLKLSNGVIQLYNSSNGLNLVMSKNQLVLIQLKDMKQVSKIYQDSRNCLNCNNKQLRSMYIKTKKILEKIEVLEKNEEKNGAKNEIKNGK